MSLLVYSRIKQIAELAALVAAVPFIAPKLRLYSNDFTPLPTSILGDFTAATFGGYAEDTLAWGAVGLDGSNTPVAPAPYVFTCDGTSAGIVYGAYLIDSTGAYVCASRFATPVNFAVNGDQLAGTVLFGLASGSFNIAVGP